MRATATARVATNNLLSEYEPVVRCPLQSTPATSARPERCMPLLRYTSRSGRWMRAVSRYGATTLTGMIWADSRGRRNTSILEVLMGRPAGWMKELTGRAPMKAAGKPSLRRDVERLFWREIARGLTSEDAAVAVGVSPAAGSRWFRERGGMATFMLAPVTGRYLSFEERE